MSKRILQPYFVNAGEKEHTLWLIKLDGGKTFDDVMGLFATIETDPQMPAWLVWYGGVSAGPGQTSAYTIDLAPGTYSPFSFSEDMDGVSDAAKGMTATLEVTEAVDVGDQPPEADLRTEMVDFSYGVEGTPAAGKAIVEVANVGMGPHEAIMLRLKDGAVVDDALEFLMAGEEGGGPPPFMMVGGAAGARTHTSSRRRSASTRGCSGQRRVMSGIMQPYVLRFTCRCSPCEAYSGESRRSNACLACLPPQQYCTEVHAEEE